MDIRERLKIFIAHSGLTVREFERSIDRSNGYVNSIRKGIPADTIERILEQYPTLNRDWLMYNEGTMLRETEGNARLVTGGIQIKQVPVVPHSARAGYILGWDDPGYLDTLETLPVIIDKEYHGEYMIFEVAGDSMDDGTSEALIDGDYVLCRKIDWTLWRDSKLHLRRWSNFVVEITSGEIVVKNIADHDVERHTITFHSRNNLYPDRVLDLAEVRNIYNVVQLVQRQMR